MKAPKKVKGEIEQSTAYSITSEWRLSKKDDTIAYRTLIETHPIEGVSEWVEMASFRRPWFFKWFRRPRWIWSIAGNCPHTCLEWTSFNMK